MFLTEPFLVGCQRLPSQLGLQAGTAGFYPFAKTGEDLVESIQSIRERALAKPLSSPPPLPAEKSKGVKWQLEKASGLLPALGCSKPQLLSLLQGTIILVLNWRFRRAY